MTKNEKWQTHTVTTTFTKIRFLPNFQNMGCFIRNNDHYRIMLFGGGPSQSPSDLVYEVDLVNKKLNLKKETLLAKGDKFAN